MTKPLITNIKAISFDLDDTLYDNKPVIRKALFALYNYLINHYPNIGIHYDVNAFVDAAIRFKRDNPLIVDLNHLRQLHIQNILENCGYNTQEDTGAFNCYWQARQEVELYPGVVGLLETLAKKVPMITISDGNACTKAIGIDHFFHWSINVTETGKAKPDPSMFLFACEKLDIAPEQLLHIGDSLEKDVSGAYRAGCRSVWFNKDKIISENHNADIVIQDLSELLAFNFF